MKKKLFVVMMAIVAMFTTSCQKEMESDANVGETSIVSFNLSTPEISTRVYGDGKNATVLQYAVYDAAGNELRDLTKTDGEIKMSTTVNLQLTNGNKYSIIFWAAAPDAPYEVDFANKKMTVDYGNVVSNSDNLDAFYAYQTFTVNGQTVVDVTLKRPFAQLNIGTSDYAISQKAGYVPTKSSVTVKQVYSTLNLEDGTVSNPIDAVFKMKAIDRNEVFPVAGNEYLAMNYLLVPADNNIVDVDFTYSDDYDNAKTREVTNVPVKRNYRTNIFGEILTSNVSINVNIEPQFDGNVVTVSTWDEFTAAASVDGNYIVLANDISYGGAIDLKNDVTIDLNENTLEVSNPQLALNIGLKNPNPKISADVTIKNGVIKGKVYAQVGNLTLSDVTFSGTIANKSSEASLQIHGLANVSAKNCVINSTDSGSGNTRPLSVEARSSGTLKFEECSFKSNTKQGQVYVNPLSGTATLDFTNCNFNNKTPNIMFAATAPFTILTMSGTTKLSSVTLETNRAKDAITDADLAYLREMLASNSFSSFRLFYAGGSNEYIQ